MYSVSDSYKTAIQDNTRSFSWSGTITTRSGKVYPFENKDIVKGSGYVSRQCSGSSEIELGSVYAAELGISLFSDIDRYSLENAEVELIFHMNLSDDTVEDVPMGIFYVAEANRKIKTLEIKAYDAMLNFDKAYSEAQSSGYPYDFLTAMCTTCHVELAHTQEEIEILPNGAELLGIYPDNDIETWRDFLHYLAQALCSFAFINREGKLQLVQYGESPVCTVNNTHRYSSSFSDFVTRYTAISSTNRRTNTAEYYSLDPDDGLTMNLETNPLLQFGLDETRSRILNNILNAISVIRYVPFDSETIGDPALEPGDVLTFTGGQADSSQMAAITSITTKINGKCSLKCVGKNPRLAEAKSKNDKDITGLINSVESTKMATYSYMNAMQVQAELVRRRAVHISPTGKKRGFSCNHCFAQMIFCGDCGELYRRVHWNNHGCKSIVWRCISRLEPSSAEMNCTNRTVNELLLQEVTVKAINQILTESDTFLKQLQANIAKAVVSADTLSPDGIQARLEELQKELIKKANNKQDYDAIADEIFRLREQKEQSEVDSHHREETMNRIKELQSFIAKQKTDITEFDEALVKKLIKKVNVFTDHFTVEFKSGLAIEIEA